MKITHVKVCNYRNLRNIDIGLAETVAIIGERIGSLHMCRIETKSEKIY